MYRLVIVSGPNRGSSFALVEGENTLGRQMDNHIVLTSSKISKRHCSILVSPQEVYLRDESSTNGTFVNGALTKKQKLKNGDKVSVGDFVLELVQIGGVPQVANSFSIQNSYESPSQSLSSFNPSQSISSSTISHPTSSQAPIVQVGDDPISKLNFIFEGKLMPNFYGLLMKNELRVIFAVLLALLVAASVVGSVMPMLDLAEKSVQRETMIRAKIIAKEVADRFLPAIANHAESQIDLSVLENEESVKMIAITNTDLQIIAPQARLNQLLAGGSEAKFAMLMAKEFKDGRERGRGGFSDENTVVYVEPIKTTDPRQVKNQVSAMVVVGIDFSGNLLQAGGLGVAYGIGFVIAGLMGIFVFFVFMRLTLKPFEVLNDDLDQVLRGDLPKVTHEFKIEELDALWSNINSALQRLPKGGSDFSNETNQSIDWEQEFASVRAIADAAGYPFVGFDGDLKVIVMNNQFQDASNIRMDALGQSINQVGDQPIRQLVSAMKEGIQRSPSRSSLDEFDFGGGGVPYQVIGAGVGPAMQMAFAMVFKRKE